MKAARTRKWSSETKLDIFSKLGLATTFHNENRKHGNRQAHVDFTYMYKKATIDRVIVCRSGYDLNIG